MKRGASQPVTRRRLTGFAIGIMTLGYAGSANAAGFALQEYSVRDLGQANAGLAARADDASTIFSNPAGMTRLDGISVTAGASAVLGSARFQDAGSRDALGQPMQGGEGGEFLADAVVPNLYVAVPVSDRIRLGVGFSAPFGLETTYDEDWVGRYQAVRSKLTTIDINPAVAVRLTDWLSVGGGVSFQYVRVNLTNAIDFGAVCFGQIEPVSPGTCGPLGLAPQAADGMVDLKGNDWAVGWNAGALIELGPGTRIGLQYRSAVKHDIAGQADFTVPDAAAPIQPLLGGAFTDTDASARLKLPARASLSLYHEVTPAWALMADVSWTDWSSVQALTVDFANPAQPEQSEPLRYRDAWRISGGTQVRLSEAWTVRAGVAWDESPTNPDFRTPRIPDNDRIVAAVGLSYRVSDSLTLDAAYNHIFIEDSDIDRTGSGGDRLIGSNRGKAHILAVGATLGF
jgi:long-chain fatty acid transport protein